jgi:hypothetical protein
MVDSMLYDDKSNERSPWGIKSVWQALTDRKWRYWRALTYYQMRIIPDQQSAIFSKTPTHPEFTHNLNRSPNSSTPLESEPGTSDKLSTILSFVTLAMTPSAPGELRLDDDEVADGFFGLAGGFGSRRAGSPVLYRSFG